MPEIAGASHDAIDTSVGTLEKTPKTRQSTPNSKARNLVSGKSHLKETIRAHLVWIAYSIARVEFTAPPINQPTTPTKNAGC